MKFGLKDTTLEVLYSEFEKIPEIEKVVIYGSRAMGNYREGSDIDITLFGENVTNNTASALWGRFDDSSLPYLFDISVFHLLQSDSLKDHIERRGQVLYERNGKTF
ncbi:nucleotidyltransferase domain-containing protein [Cruoricaptor ignavus]|uniref:Nucleotidyltransferase domain-containing protein n=1 Tax=Cruoricaptor ignavus TaxID=1118202 RepID=A0A7M1T1Z1_9FLAO|nr:nucleotidyltransferase domain-containing protein [Cruoricaptor ignavus]QOR73825.1 nucleotidyltransferase domain-containing protein [Cruoricaptor ignavus]